MMSHYGAPDVDILRPYWDIWHQTEKRPTKKEINASPNIASNGTFQNRFGGLAKAAQRAIELFRDPVDRYQNS